MTAEVVMPKLSKGMTEGTVAKWLKKEGEKVEKGEPLLEVMTEKAAYEVESPAKGVLSRILVAEEEISPVGSVLGIIEESNSGL